MLELGAKSTPKLSIASGSTTIAVPRGRRKENSISKRKRHRASELDWRAVHPLLLGRQGWGEEASAPWVHGEEGLCSAAPRHSARMHQPLMRHDPVVPRLEFSRSGIGILENPGHFLRGVAKVLPVHQVRRSLHAISMGFIRGEK